MTTLAKALRATIASKAMRTSLTLVAAVVASEALHGGAQTTAGSPRPSSPEAAAPRDGQHDFDFDIGTWKTQLSRRLKPLSGSNTWVKYEGTTVVTKVWNGRANLAELEADGPAGHIQVLSLRLYNPTSRQWSLNSANSTGGTLSVPTVGGFKNGRGEFFDFEEYNGRMILVRNVWSDITPDSCRFEQAFSDDGGTTWEVNWIAVDTRIAASAMRQPTRGER